MIKAVSGLLGACLLSIACDPADRVQSQAIDSPPFPLIELPAYSVMGQVADAAGRPIMAARVEVIAPGFEGLFAIADSQGRYRIHNLVGGVLLEASKDGFLAVSRGVSGPADAVVDFALQPFPR